MSVKLPNTYMYSFTHDDYITYSVRFVNETVEGNVATDHAAPYSMRHDFVFTIKAMPAFPFATDVWTDLPDHPYIQFLANNGFHYNKFTVDTEGDYCWITVM